MDNGPCHMQTQEIEPGEQPFRPAIPLHKINVSVRFAKTGMADHNVYGYFFKYTFNLLY